MPEEQRNNQEEGAQEQIRDPLPDKLKKSVVSLTNYMYLEFI